MTGSPSYQRLFAELKRRNVFQVAAVYGATAFVIIEASDLAGASVTCSNLLEVRASLLDLLEQRLEARVVPKSVEVRVGAKSEGRDLGAHD